MTQRYFYLQAPVGNKGPYLLSARTESVAGFRRLTGWGECWTATGTMALAAALQASIMDPDAAAKPKVALAAYGCPDLVAAIHFAGAEPLYIDTAADRPWIDLSRLELALKANPNVVAVIGVDLFGISERWEQLRQIVAGSKIALIQDCAQSVQPLTQLAGDLHGDMVVFSFGRGKPVYLGGGGLLLGKPAWAQRVAGAAERVQRRTASEFLRNAKIAVYNLLIRPRIYPILSFIMGDRLGEVRYVTLPAIVAESERFGALANQAIEWAANTHSDAFQLIHEALQPVIEANPSLFGSVFDPAGQNIAGKRYLRYPLLIKDESARQTALERFKQSGISSTLMYRQTLPDLIADSVGRKIECEYPRASTFATQLLTLPVHGRLTSTDVAIMKAVLLGLVKKR